MFLLPASILLPGPHVVVRHWCAWIGRSVVRFEGLEWDAPYAVQNAIVFEGKLSQFSVILLRPHNPNYDFFRCNVATNMCGGPITLVHVVTSWELHPKSGVPLWSRWGLLLLAPTA